MAELCGSAADAARERDAHAGDLALEGTDHQFLAVREVEAGPVQLRHRLVHQRRELRQVREPVAFALEHRAHLRDQQFVRGALGLGGGHVEGVDGVEAHGAACGGIGVREVMDYLTEYIGKLDVCPVIMGHSFGGTFAQLLVGNGLGSASVSIDGAGVKGLKALPFSELRSTFPVLKNPATSKRAVVLSPEQFQYAFTNTLTEEASRRAYDR